MAQRLIDTYMPGQAVEILLVREEQAEWQRGRVLAHQHPGVWVKTEDDGRMWFVTNGKRIRPLDPLARESS